MNKVAIIGLDCAEPSLVFDKWRDDLPCLKRLMDNGKWKRLRSTDPPITVPAWTSMMTGKDPGELGFYGFRNRKDYSYGGYVFANSTMIKHDLVWDVLSRSGKKVLLLGVPQTFPPKKVNGNMVTCFLSVSTKYQYTYPVDLKMEVEEVSDGYVLDVTDFRTDDKDALLGRIYEKAEKHFKVAKHLVATKPWDFFMMVEMGIDRIHHAFWKYMDETHPKYEKGNRYQDVIKEFYQYCDNQMNELISLFPADTTIIVVSDHGAKRLVGGVCFNEWLIEQGFLSLESYPQEVTPIDKVSIDWSRTRAWGDGGYYGRLFLNVLGRESQGTIPPEDYEDVRRELISKIEAIEDDKGRNIGSRAYRPEDLYKECNGIPPDLIVYFGDLEWRSVGSVGSKSILTFENDIGPDDANHDWHGIFIISGKNMDNEYLESMDIYKINSLILELMGA